MCDLAVLFIHLITTICKLMGPSGARSVVAESLLVKQQLLIVTRARQRAPKLNALDRIVFGLDINKDIVRRVLAQHYRPPPNGSSPSWLTFLGHALCRMFNQAIKNQSAPKYLSSNHDPLFTYHRWRANLRILEIEEIKTVPYVPISHPFVERVIGTIRRECLDKTLFWNERDLERKLLQFKDYYNGYRTHDSLQGETPSIRAETIENKVIDLANHQWKSHCRGLFQTSIAA
ncbi:MAG: transposase family protein [Gammaproteobacteria bacterium]|nr:transposase family protein [Gammaproteobacteria bacterium]